MSIDYGHYQGVVRPHVVQKLICSTNLLRSMTNAHKELGTPPRVGNIKKSGFFEKHSVF